MAKWVRNNSLFFLDGEILNQQSPNILKEVGVNKVCEFNRLFFTYSSKKYLLTLNLSSFLQFESEEQSWENEEGAETTYNLDLHSFTKSLFIHINLHAYILQYTQKM